jgi:hypothetical protein
MLDGRGDAGTVERSISNQASDMSFHDTSQHSREKEEEEGKDSMEKTPSESCSLTTPSEMSEMIGFQVSSESDTVQ